VPYHQLLTDFTRGNEKLAFKCIDNRLLFAQALEQRVKEPWRIAQSGTPLCGPAAFMYCIAKDRPSTYVKYVIDLAEEGIAKLNKLTVEPGNACKNASLKESIHPVDWVALASLRDSSNAILPVSRPSVSAAGITTATSLAGWFSATKWFNASASTTYTSSQAQRFKHLLAINDRRTDSHICLLIRSPIITRYSSSDIGLNKWNGSGTQKPLRAFPTIGLYWKVR